MINRRPAQGGEPSEGETYADLLQQAIEELSGTDAPRLTAEVVLAHVLGLTRAQVLTHPERPVPPEARQRFAALIARAAQGEPLAYLIGQREFYGLTFAVNPHALIPRPETETLIDVALKFLANRQAPHPQMVDVGTGSGCIAVTLALHCPAAHLTALDFSSTALQLARTNAERHGVVDRITFVQNDLLQSLPSDLPPPTLLCANLPYIASDELRELAVARHEPHLALDGGEDGLGLIRRLLKDAPRVMARGGCVVLEIGATQGAAVMALAGGAFPSAALKLHRDFAGLERVVEIQLE